MWKKKQHTWKREFEVFLMSHVCVAVQELSLYRDILLLKWKKEPVKLSLTLFLATNLHKDKKDSWGKALKPNAGFQQLIYLTF